MLETRDRLGFANQPLMFTLLAIQEGQNLEGYLTLELLVAGLPDRSLPTASNSRLERVVFDDTPRTQSDRVRREPIEGR